MYCPQAPQLEVYEAFGAGHSDAIGILRAIQDKPEWLAFEKNCALLAGDKYGSSNPGDERSGLPTFFVSIPPHPPDHSSPPTPVTDLLPAVTFPSGEQIEDHSHSVPLIGKMKRAQSVPSPVSSGRKTNSPSTESSSAKLAPPSAYRSSSRAALQPLWRRNSAADPDTAMTPLTEGNDSIPPVPSLPSSKQSSGTEAPNGSYAPRTKRLAFRDLLIKPIQRICRYPLLLEQLRDRKSISNENDALDEALGVMKRVAQGVDDAREKREAAARSQLLLSRLETHLVRLFILV